MKKNISQELKQGSILTDWLLCEFIRSFSYRDGRRRGCFPNSRGTRDQNVRPSSTSGRAWPILFHIIITHDSYYASKGVKGCCLFKKTKVVRYKQVINNYSMNKS